MIAVQCPGCRTQLSVKDELAGRSGKCPKCGHQVKVPLSHAAKPARSETPPSKPAETIAVVAPQTPLAIPPFQSLVPATVVSTPAARPVEVLVQPHLASRRLDSQLSGLLAPFLNEAQDPGAVAQAYEKVQQVLTRGEELLYIAVQKKPVVNLMPDCAVLTSRRFIVYHAKLLGRATFDDYIWRDLFDVRLTEGIMGATLAMKTVRGTQISIDYLPKLQARKLYRFAQEMEEKALEERRAREMEERRAAAGGIVVNSGGLASAAPLPPAPGATSADDPVQKLRQLKEMLDTGMISPDEFAAKKADILAKM